MGINQTISLGHRANRLHLNIVIGSSLSSCLVRRMPGKTDVDDVKTAMLVSATYFHKDRTRLVHLAF